MNPLDNTSGLQANGRYSTFPLQPPGARQRSTRADAADPARQPLRPTTAPRRTPTARTARPATRSARRLFPGQAADNPAFGVSNIPGALGIPNLGKTDLFLLKNGTRVFTGQ